MSTTTLTPLSVAPGTESQGDARAQRPVTTDRRTPSEIVDGLVGALARLIGWDSAGDTFASAYADLVAANGNRRAEWSAVSAARRTLEQRVEEEWILAIGRFYLTPLPEEASAEARAAFEAAVAMSDDPENNARVNGVLALWRATDVAERESGLLRLAEREAAEAAALAARQARNRAKSARCAQNGRERAERNRRFAASCPAGPQGRQNSAQKKKGKGR